MSTGNSVTDGFLEDNQIASSGLDAIHLDNAAGWHISGNHLYDIGQNAIIAQRLFGTTISGNYVEDFGDRKRPGYLVWHPGLRPDGNGSTIVGNKVFNAILGVASRCTVFISASRR